MNDFDPTVIDMSEQTTDEFEYLTPFIDKIKNINIRDFDPEIFQKYIEELNDTEFEKLWSDKLLELLKEIDELYLTVDIDEFLNSSTEAQKFMFIEYIEFLMDVLPYKIVFSKYLKKQFKDLTDLENWLDNKNISNDLSILLEEDIVIINNMYNLIKTTVHASRRSDEYEQRIDKLKYYLDHKKEFKEYFISLVEDTDNEKLKNLIIKYYESEYL